MTENTKYIDYLIEDEPIPGQLWVCISFLSPEGIKNCSVRGLKIRGVYGTRQEADKRADELHKKDPDFHVFVGEMGKWLPWDPDPNDIKDQVYLEKEMNDLMKGYKESQEKSAMVQEQRKKDMIKQAAQEEQARMNAPKQDPRAQNQKSKMQKQHAANQEQKKLSQMEKKLSEVDEKLKRDEKELNDERLRLNKTQTEIATKEENVASLDSKIDKIRSLYEKMNKNKQS